MGADLHFFSPLAGDSFPDCDALWLPGGYPELHAEALANNRAFLDALRAHHERGKPILAECGGMMVCAQELETIDGQSHAMAGLMPGRTIMQSRLGGLGLLECPWPGGTLRGHGFHYSRIETDLAPFAQTRNPNGGRSEALFVRGSLRASYVHSYFRSNSAAAASLFRNS